MTAVEKKEKKERRKEGKKKRRKEEKKKRRKEEKKKRRKEEKKERRKEGKKKRRKEEKKEQSRDEYPLFLLYGSKGFLIVVQENNFVGKGKFIRKGQIYSERASLLNQSVEIY